MEFSQFNSLLRENFVRISKDATHLFETDLDKDKLWELYLNSFPPGANEMYRERREMDCSCCRHFVKNAGNIIIIKDNKVTTIWDFETNDSKFQPVVNALSKFVKAHTVTNVFISKIKKIGTPSNYEQLPDGKIKEWTHFNLDLSNIFVDRSIKSEADIKGTYRDTRNVFKRSLDEITEDSIQVILELISQNSLYKGEEWKNVLDEFLKYKKEYSKLQLQDKENYAWEQSLKAGAVIGRIRNHSIGTLLINISEGMDLDKAVKKYEDIVAPHNYKRPKAIFTKKMLEDAQKKLEELGYMGSLGRRYATLDDITVNNILFSNKDSAKRISGSVFEEMAQEVSISPKKFGKVEEISAEAFIKEVLPMAKELEVFLENKLSSNMVSLVAPENKDSEPMFKWNNGFSWAYAGNITDSSMKERVKSAGGKIDGVLRFSIQWNDGSQHDQNDLDAHCEEPNGYKIYFGNKRVPSPTGGMLDVDIQWPQKKGEVAVENITWADTNKMKEGKYKFYVNNFAHRGGRDGFRAEIEFDGQIYSFEYNNDIRYRENVHVAEVIFSRQHGFSIVEKLPSNISSRDIWNLKTNQFVPVSVAMFSPNYWDEQHGIGHKHYFFMLKGCVNPENPNGFYNEFLKEELMEHKRVFEALGGKMAVKDVEDQLSGLGFSSTKRSELIVKVKGQAERVIKVKF